MRKFKSTEEIPIPGSLIGQVIGQDSAVRIVKKAAAQKRNVLMIGTPGTGKSMLAQAMAELMPATDVEDVLVYPNPNDENRPIVKAVKTYPSEEEIKKDPQLFQMYSAFRQMQQMVAQFAPKSQAQKPPKKEEMGQGRMLQQALKGRENAQGRGGNGSMMFLFIIIAVIVFLYATGSLNNDNKWFVLAVLVAVGFLYLLYRFTNTFGRKMGIFEYNDPKLIVDNSGRKTAPFVDATGTRAGALLGDVKHDPLQCILGNEIVYLKNGKPIKISEMVDPLIREGEKELSAHEIFEVMGGYDARYCYTATKVCKIFKRKYDGEIYTIETRRGHRIRVTPNHPLAFVKEDGTIDYLEAEKIGKDAHLVLPYRLPIYKTANIDSDFLTFLAYFLADGYMSARTIGFKVKRQFKIEEIERCLKANNFDYKKRVYRGATIFNVNSAALVRKLIQMGVKKDGKKSIPSIIYDLDKEDIMTFISSYLSLDGYINKQGQFELFSKELIEEFVPLFLKIGVRSVINERTDPGYGKEKKNVQKFILFNNYEFAVEYSKRTINPHHKINSRCYLNNSEGTHVTFADEIPLSFEILEQMREKTGLSQAKVHKAYYALKPGLKTSQALTRGMLSSVCNSLLSQTNCPKLFQLKNISEGSYSFDTIEKIEKERYSGYVYNLTTETGNYLVNNVLTHNSGGLGTPAHLRVESGAIHRANKGVLFIDEVASLKMRSQQELLTAMQEKKYSITGQSETSSGAIVKTEPVPCDFVLVAAGNIFDMRGMHPALRSRIRGNGYEVFVQDTMDDTPENEDKYVQFVAQEVRKDAKIPHFTYEAVAEILDEARRKAGRKRKLSLNLRELGGLVRAAGDIANEEKALIVDEKHVTKARGIAQTIEQQISRRFVESRKDYQVFLSEGEMVGKVNGLAVLGDSMSGLILPIVAEVTPASSKAEGKLIATGKLGTIAKEAVENVSAIIKKHIGKDVSQYDMHVQFLQTYEGVEGDSASISIAVAIISAMEGIPVRQDVAMTGSLSVRGEVLPVGGVTGKTEAAIEAGVKKVIVPASNAEDIHLSGPMKKMIRIIPVENFVDVLQHALVEGEKKRKLIRKMSGMLKIKRKK